MVDPQSRATALPFSLNDLLLTCLKAVDWQAILDYEQGDHLKFLPSIDLAVILFPTDTAKPIQSGHVLLARHLPQGYASRIDPETLAVTDVRWCRDLGPEGRWDQRIWTPHTWASLLPGQTGVDFISPYPASVLKLLVGVGIMQTVEQDRISLDQDLEYKSSLQPVARWMEQMLQLSDDRATFALIKLLHDLRVIQTQEAQPDCPCAQRQQRQDRINLLNSSLACRGLLTLQLNNTRACDGSFYNSAGAGVGQIHMTAWDTVRLLWLLDPDAPPPTWKTPAGDLPPLLSPMSQRYLVEQLLGEQGFHDVLSTTAVCGRPGVQEGIPALLPQRWIDPDGCRVRLQDNQEWQDYTQDVRPCNAGAEVTFAHKTGLTKNYASDVGIVRGLPDRGHHRHYIIAFFSNLGYRYTDQIHPGEAKYASGRERAIWYTQRIATLAHLIDQGIKCWLRDGISSGSDEPPISSA
ncbi:MAG: serine hydrolase [Synechococcaceae cyanobacterium SM2_3_1]|nr:serine hydrolase [Synechococcaceae cyanobacterium SM2_3_1]